MVVTIKAIEYINQFISDKESENTRQAFKSDLEQFFKWLDKDIDELKSQDINSFIDFLLSKKRKTSTINRKLVSVRNYVNFLNNLKTGIIILAEIKSIKIQKQEFLQDVLTKAEFDRMVKAAEQRNDKRAIAMFYALYMTGARVSEMLQIKVEDVENDTMTVKGKGSKYRDLLFSSILQIHLKNYIKVRGEGGHEQLFINVKNKNKMSRKSVHNLIKEYAGICKIKKTKAHAHSFRHLCAIMLIGKGHGIDSVAEILGHENINTTRIYTRLTKKDLIKSLDRLADD